MFGNKKEGKESKTKDSLSDAFQDNTENSCCDHGQCSCLGDDKERIDLQSEFGPALDPEYNVHELRENHSTMNKQNEELRKENEDLKDKILRKIAEFENYKKIVMKQKSDDRMSTLSDLISKFLPVLENIKRAICSYDTASGESFFSGVKMIGTQVEEVFSRIGVEKIDCLGKVFDPRYHEAISHVEKEGVGQNVIVEVYEEGYIYQGKVIKHSVVCVAN